MQSALSLPSLAGLLWPGVVAPDKVLTMGQLELNCVLMPNKIASKRTVFVCKIELFEIKLFFDFETVYLCETELLEIELFKCIKIDLALLTYYG